MLFGKNARALKDLLRGHTFGRTVYRQKRICLTKTRALGATSMNISNHSAVDASPRDSCIHVLLTDCT